MRHSFGQLHLGRQLLLLGLALLLPISARAASTVDLDATFEVDGKVPDMQQQIQSSGFAFKVSLQNISYSGKIHRTKIEPTADDRLTVWVALKNATLTINNTDIRGKRHSAECGPLKLVLGNRREIWIAFDVAKKGDKVELLKTRFRLPRDNWSVGTPSWVTTSGFGMTESKVANGLKNGLAKNSAAVERQLIRVAPDIFAQVEQQIVRDLSSKEEVLKVALKSKVASNK